MIFAGGRLRRRTRAAAVARWADAHAARLHHAACRLASPAEADDLCQDVFVIATRRYAEFDGRSAVYTWLYGILRTLVWERRKKARRRGLRVIEPDEALSPDPESTLADHQQRAQVRAAVATLPPAQRVVVELFYLESLPVTEIARRLQVPAGTVKSRLFQARKALRHALQEIPDAM